MKKNTLLAIFSGLLLWLAWPPANYTTFFLFFGLAPMLVVVEDIIRSTSLKKGKRIFWTTFLGFFIWNTLSIYWVYNSLKIVGEITAIPITLIPYSLGPLLMSAAFWSYYKMRVVTGKRGWSLVGLVCFWIAYEYLHQSWDLNFPWMTLGNGFAVAHQWVQWYEYTGVYGGTVWIWTLNILIFLLYTGLSEAQTRSQRMKLISGLVLVLALPLGFSLNRYYNYEEAINPSNIVVAQPNIDPYEKNGSIPPYQQIETLTKLCDSVGQVNTEFFIWPETAIPEFMNEDKIRSNDHYLQAQRFLRKYPNGTLITGAETYKLYNDQATETASPLPDGGYADSFNTAVSIENSAEVHFYHKSKLVPGAESLPFASALSFLKPVFAHLGGATGAYAGQKQPGVLYAQSGIGAAPAICFDSIWGEWVAGSVKQGAQFIAIMTNDGWWENTTGKDQHLDYAKLRAIETRRWVCRSANTGISAFINQRGDIIQQSKWWVRAALKQDINLNSDLTFYVTYGDYIPKAASLLAILGILFISSRVLGQRKASRSEV